jgi:adenylate kinase
MTLDLRLKMSEEFTTIENNEKWHCMAGIGNETFRLLNEEFNMFRGLFPLKVFIGGPPGVGKTHYANKLADSYGIPHLTMAGMVDHAVKEESTLGDSVRGKIEILKDQVLEDYEKTRKKKDPDLNRDDIKPRLPEDVICKIVQARIESPACMNKGFILDGFPKNQTNAQAVFYCPIPGYQAPEEEEGKALEPLAGLKLHEKILPQYAICLEADDAFLK